MDTNKHNRSWVSLQGLPVVTLSDGIKVGTVDDFYLDPESNEVHALQINCGIFGTRALLSEFITEIQQDVITAPNPQAIIDPKHDGRLPVLILGSTLRSYTLMSENNQTIGPVADTILDTYPPLTLRLVGFVLGGSREIVPANAATEYDEETIYILNKVAKSFL